MSKAKAKKPLLPVTKETDHPVSQSKLKANTSSWNEGQENVYERVTIGFGFTSDWMTKWQEFIKPIA